MIYVQSNKESGKSTIQIILKKVLIQMYELESFALKFNHCTVIPCI